jgi:hypothetical protein
MVWLAAVFALLHSARADDDTARPVIEGMTALWIEPIALQTALVHSRSAGAAAPDAASSPLARRDSLDEASVPRAAHATLAIDNPTTARMVVSVGGHAIGELGPRQTARIAPVPAGTYRVQLAGPGDRNVRVFDVSTR